MKKEKRHTRRHHDNDSHYPQYLQFEALNMASDILPPSDKKGKAREKVALKPGFHLTDWMRLTQHANDLSGRQGQIYKILLLRLD